MQVKEIMTENPVCCTPDSNLQEVARLMLEHDCGLIPVVNNQENKKPVGTITDRDIAIRTFAAGQNPLEIKASNIMTMGVTTVKPETSVQECCDVMENKKIRRVLVVDTSGGVCGIVAQADVAEYGHPNLISNMVEEISESEASPNPRRFMNSRNNQSYSNERSSFRMAPPPAPIRMENTPRFPSEKYRKSNEKSSFKKSSFGFSSLLPLLVGIGTGAALKYYYMPDKESKSRVVARRDLTTAIKESRDEISRKPIDLSKSRETPQTESKDVITGRVTASTQADKLNTGINSTQEDKSKTDTGIGRSAS